MRGGREEQQAARQLLEPLPQPEPLRLVDLVAVEMGRHLVGLVDDHQIPLRDGQLGQQLVIARQLIKAGDQHVPFAEGVGRAGRLHHVAGEDIEIHAELVREFLLPLLHQRTGGDYQTSGEVAAQDQLTYVEARHDGLARAGVVSKQKTERPQRQQALVDGFDLMGKRVDAGSLHRRERIEQVGELDAAGLRRQPEQPPVGVERPSPLRRYLETLGVGRGYQLLIQNARIRAVDKVDDPAAAALDGHHLDRAARDDSRHPNALFYLAQIHRRPVPSISPRATARRSRVRQTW